MSRQRWFDCYGQELHPGDKVRGIGASEVELVYECHPDGNPYDVSLGLNASNEKYLKLHPDAVREIYPFDEFSYTIKSGDRWLLSYQKVW